MRRARVEAALNRQPSISVLSVFPSTSLQVPSATWIPERIVLNAASATAPRPSTEIGFTAPVPVRLMYPLLIWLSAPRIFSPMTPGKSPVMRKSLNCALLPPPGVPPVSASRNRMQDPANDACGVVDVASIVIPLILAGPSMSIPHAPDPDVKAFPVSPKRAIETSEM